MRLSFLIILLLLCSTQTFAQSHQLVKLWETDSILKIPESVVYDGENQVLYFSNIDGKPGDPDGKGSIGKLGLDGKVIALEWVTGLNAPLGIAKYKDRLYVADINEVVIIDITKGQVVSRVAIFGAQFLNDVSVDEKGIVYVSDSRAKKLYRIEKGQVYLVLENLSGPNGVLARGKNTLYLLDNGVMNKVTINREKNVTPVATGMEGGTDGIENVEGDDFLVSCWSGVIYYVKADGSKEVLLDTREAKINTADIGYDAKNRIVYVPTFYKKSVVAYQLK